MSEFSPEAVVPVSCRNCGALAPRYFCAECGQKTDTSVPTLAELTGDLFRELTDFDSRIWRTLGALLRPGRLTLAYLAGQRARYVGPARIYLTVSILAFLVFAIREDFDFEAANEASRAAAEDAVASERRCTMNLDWLGSSASAQRVRDNCDRVFSDREAVGELFATFTDNLPLLAFLIIPVMAVFFKLFYLFSGRAYLEHVTFLTHNHAFTLCFMAFMDLFGRIDNVIPALANPVQTIALLLPWPYLAVYFFMAMRKVYQQSRALTFVKLLLLIAVYGVVAGAIFSLGFFFTLFNA
jgi:hypothetical protein